MGDEVPARRPIKPKPKDPWPASPGAARRRAHR